MGDRANVYMKSEENSVYLYTHWEGYRLPDVLQAALKRGIGRWTDEIYLGRIIFSEMIKDNVLEELGYGISSYVGDGWYRILEVDTDKQTVTAVYDTPDSENYRRGKSWSFQEFLDLDIATQFEWCK